MAGDAKWRALLEGAVAAGVAGYDEAWRKVMAYGHHHVWATLRDIREMDRYNCFAFSLCVEMEYGYRKLVEQHQSSVLVSSEFMGHLFAEGMMMPVESDRFELADVVLYYDGDTLKHAARVEVPNKLLRSKWGSGFVYEHALWEVPAMYGDRVMVARGPSPMVVMKKLHAWVE